MSKNPSGRILLFSVFAILFLLISQIYTEATPAFNFGDAGIAAKWLSDIIPETNIISILAGCFFLAINCISIFILENSINEMQLFAILFYIILVLSNPASVFFTPLHIAVPVFFCGSSFLIRYRTEKQGFGRVLSAFTLFSAASLLYHPLIWVVIILFIINFTETEIKSKYLFTSVIGIITPFAIYIAIKYLINGFSDFGYLAGNFWSSATSVAKQDFFFSSPTFCKIAIITVCTMSSIIYILRNRLYFSEQKTIFLSQMMIITAILTLLMIVFVNQSQTPFGVMLFFPVSFLLSESFSRWNRKGRFGIYYLLFLVIIAIERIDIIGIFK